MENKLMNETTIRFATPEDAAGILAIYNHYITETITTFNIRPRTEHEHRAYIESICKQYPWLVAEKNNEIIAYAYAHTERPIDAYAWNVELAIFLKPDVTAAGLGTRMLATLLAILEYAGYKNAYSVISETNDASFALHEKFGFELIGVHSNTGFKQGKWRDTTWLVKRLGDFETIPPAPVKMPQEWDPAELDRILTRY